MEHGSTLLTERCGVPQETSLWPLSGADGDERGAVATELEHLEVRLVATEEKLGQLTAKRPEIERAVEETGQAHHRASVELAVRRNTSIAS